MNRLRVEAFMELVACALIDYCPNICELSSIQDVRYASSASHQIGPTPFFLWTLLRDVATSIASYVCYMPYKFIYRTILCDKTSPFIRPVPLVLACVPLIFARPWSRKFPTVSDPLFSFVIYWQCNSRLPIPIVYARRQDCTRSSIGIVAGS